MTRREFLKACGVVAVGAALMRPVYAVTRRREPEPAALPPDSAYERIKTPRIDCMLADGDPQQRLAINREFVALAFEMKDAGASRGHIMTMAQATLYHAKREVATMGARADARRMSV
jgi:hypothetical protein